MTLRFIPDTPIQGGSLFGTSYTNDCATCLYRWFNGYLRPHPDSPSLETGIRPRFASPFLTAGSTAHIGFAVWYGSGVRDGADTGERDIDRAIQAARAHHDSSTHQYEESDRAERDWNMIEVMLRGYHDRYGPHGSAPEWPELQVVCDGNGEPLIEREFRISLGYRDYVFTTRPDLIITLRGLLRTRDHKTSIWRFVNERKRWTAWDPQFKGEYLALATLFPNEPIDRAEANIVVKDHSPKSTKSKFDVAERESISCSEIDLWAYKLELIDILRQIDERVARYHLARESGHDIETAACEVFPRHGTRTQACTSYGGCAYQTLCLHKDHIDQGLRHFNPRAVEDRDAARERPY